MISRYLGGILLVDGCLHPIELKEVEACKRHVQHATNSAGNWSVFHGGTSVYVTFSKEFG